jgi:hypothetical protein
MPLPATACSKALKHPGIEIDAERVFIVGIPIAVWTPFEKQFVALDMGVRT